MNSATTTAAVSRRRSQGGPPLLVPGLIFAVLTIAGLPLGVGGPRPGASAAKVLAYDTGHQTLLKVLAAVVFGSALPLAIWTATAFARLRGLGVTAAGNTMGLAGGLLASASLALSGVATWTAATSVDPASPGLARALTNLGFAAGGPGFVVPLGLLIAGVGVPSLILRLMPRALAWAGLVIAALAMLATFALLTSALYPLLPIGRFGGLIWVVAVSALLIKKRDRQAGRTPE